jgi:transcription elongation GreA/GreB family factor
MGWSARLRQHCRMTENPSHTAGVNARPAAPPLAARGVTLTAAGYDALVRELELLCAAHRAELEQRLRDARTFGSPGDDDERLAVLEDVAVDQMRIAQLERLVADATVIHDTPRADGRAHLGSVVTVQDRSGRTVEYELVGRRDRHTGVTQVSLRSPVGEALHGARPGDVVRIVPPNGRERVLRVLDVSAAPATAHGDHSMLAA